MNPLFRIDFSISDSLKIVRKSVLIYETIIAPGIPPSEEFSYAFRSPLWRGLDNLSRLPCRKSLKSSSEIHFQVALMVKAFIFQAVALLLIYVACRTMANVLL